MISCVISSTVFTYLSNPPDFTISFHLLSLSILAFSLSLGVFQDLRHWTLEYVHIHHKLILYTFNWLCPIFCFCCLRYLTHIFFTVYPNIFISGTEKPTPYRPHQQACHIVLFMAVS